MDEVTKKWRKFLLEGKEVPYQIYCDMDGVLVDLEEGVIEALGMEDIEEETRAAAIQVVRSGEVWQGFKDEKQFPELSKGVKEIFKTISKNSNFWANLPLKDDAQQLLSYIASMNPTQYILSAPWDEASRKGKILWLSHMAENLKPVPKKDKIILTHDKHLYAVNPVTGEPNILIDDMRKYLDPWRKALKKAGHSTEYAIEHISTERTINKLEELLGIKKLKTI